MKKFFRISIFMRIWHGLLKRKSSGHKEYIHIGRYQEAINNGPLASPRSGRNVEEDQFEPGTDAQAAP